MTELVSFQSRTIHKNVIKIVEVDPTLIYGIKM